MIESFFDVVIYLFSVGFVQAILALVIAVTLLPLAAWITQCSYVWLAGRFLLFNLFLLGWGIVGNFFWLRLTADRFWMLDDTPVCAPFLPPTPDMFDSVGGGRNAWGLAAGTTFPQLYWLWTATAVPVWLFAGLSLWAYARRVQNPRQIG